METEKNSRKHSLIIICFLLYSICINLYGGDPVIRLPNGETRYLTKSEPMLFITKENGKVTSIESINLEEEIDIIVSFKGKPLCLQDKGVRLSKTMEARSEHDAFKSELNRLSQVFQNKIKKPQSLSLDYSIKYEYYQAFNGISLTCKRGIADMIRSLPMVENVYLDREVKINLDKSVPQIRADRVQNELGLTGEGILVGIVDTGIDYMHPALGEGFGPSFRVIGGYDFINEDADPVDDHGHGTHVAGIVGASSDSLVGVAPGVHFIAAKVLDENGGGWTSTVLAGIDLCLDPDGNPGTDDAVDIMNFSLGSSPGVDDPLEIAVNNASEAGILCVVAAGNSGKESPFGSGFETIDSPGIVEKALTVGACDSAFILAEFSSKGPDPIYFRIKPEIVAPGVVIKSSILDGETAKYSGTSMATPHVAGVAALLKEQHPDWTSEQIKWAIVNSARPLDEEYNPYRQGTGCVDAWNAAHQEIIVQPGVLSFGMVDLALDVWKDTLSFSIKNTGTQSQQVLFTRDDDLPVAVQLNVSQSSMTLNPGEEASITAEIVVPSSVPIVEEEPFAYSGSLLCLSSTDTTRVPFGFTKANVLVVECDIAPDLIILWDLNSVDNQVIPGTGERKYYITSQQGNYNILTLMHILEDTTNYLYYVQRKDVEIGGLTYQTISHEEAGFYAFPGPIYDINNTMRTDEDLIDRTYDIEVYQSQGDSVTATGEIFGSDKNVYVSAFDSSLSFNVIGLWKPVDDLLVLNYQIRGIENAEDLIPPSGSENLTQCNVHFCELNENLIVPGLPERDDSQIIWWNNYEFGNVGKSKTSIGSGFEKVEFSQISFLKTPTSFNPDKFYSISLGMRRENREYELGDLWTDENGQPFIFERPGRRNRISEQMIERYIVGSNDTLQFNPGEEIYLPAIDNFDEWNNQLIIFDMLRYSEETAISPTGIYEEFLSRIYANQPVLNYHIYKKTQSKPFEFNTITFIAHDIQKRIRYRILGNTDNYYLLGQNGHTTVDYEFYLPESGENTTLVNSPNIDQLIVLSNDRAAQWLRPAGENNKVRLLFYDANHDIDEIQCFLIPPSGEKIALDLEIDQDKREVFAAIPDALPHEFIDFEAMVMDSSGNQTIFTAAPAFFYGNSLEERVYDSRIFLYKYNLENIEQFPFSAGDSLSFTLDFTNNGNVTADSIVIKYPTTSMFQPMGEDNVVISNLSTGDSTAVTLHLQVLGDNSEDKHFVYTPEIHWKTNGKSYKREYPMYIKTREPEVTRIYPEPDVSTKLTYQLSCNYPNPFNPETFIRYSIPQSGRVTITLYNVLGQKVRTLFEKYHPAGNYVYNFIAGDLPSGIYFYRMESGEFSQVKKMILMK